MPRPARNGRSIFSPSKISFTHEHELANDRVQAIYQDGNGLLWIGTRGAGVSLFLKDTIQTFGMTDGLASDFIIDLAEDEHHNLIAANWRGIDRMEGERFIPCVALPTSGAHVRENLPGLQPEKLCDFNRKSRGEYAKNAKFQNKSYVNRNTSRCALRILGVLCGEAFLGDYLSSCL